MQKLLIKPSSSSFYLRKNVMLQNLTPRSILECFFRQLCQMSPQPIVVFNRYKLGINSTFSRGPLLSRRISNCKRIFLALTGALLFFIHVLHLIYGETRFRIHKSLRCQKSLIHTLPEVVIARASKHGSPESTGCRV